VRTFQHNGRSGAFRRWLRVTLVHRVQGYWRSNKSRRTIQGAEAMAVLEQMADPTSDPNLVWDREHDTFITRSIFSMIEPEFTASTVTAVQRHVVDGLSPKAAATELGTSTNAVLIAKSRVLRRFREEARGLIDESVAVTSE